MGNLTAEQISLARRLSSHPNFKWEMGMLAIYDDPTAVKPLFLTHPADYRWVEGKAYPDLSDSSTVGVLLFKLSEKGVEEVVKAPLQISKENFGFQVAQVLLKELSCKNS